MPEPMSKNSRTGPPPAPGAAPWSWGARGGVPGMGGAPPVPAMLELTVDGVEGFSHSPDRSGLPSGALGAGAARLISPDRVRGTPWVLKVGHCAWTMTDVSTTAPIAH